MTSAPGRARSIATWMLVAVLVGFTAFCLAWKADGGQWMRVDSPSMGTQAPVGSLLWVKPADFESLQAGDFISFRQPGGGPTYSHNVLRRNDNGTLTTKGVIPGPDPWELSDADVIGEVRMTWLGVGWLVKAAPILVIGGFLVLALRALVRRHYRLPLVLLGGAVVLAIAITVHKPFVNAEQLSFAPARGGGADASYVGTGLLPIKLVSESNSAESAVMGPGEVGRIHVAQASGDGKLRVRLEPAIPWWFWVLLIGACLAPAIGTTLRGLLRRR